MQVKKKHIAIIFLIIAIFVGCSSKSKQNISSDSKSAELIVVPDTISIGIINLLNREILIQGKGFKPHDAIFIKITDVEIEGKINDINIADAIVDKKGNFKTKIEKTIKINEFLRASTSVNDSIIGSVITVSKPPISAKNYKIRAESMESEMTAECALTINKPSLIDKLTDWIGKKFLGRILEIKNGNLD